jgi:hypothetical protein
LGPASSVDALRPKGPVIGLLVFAVREAVREAMPHGVLGVPEFLAAPAAVAGSGFDHPLAATLTGGGVGGSRHCKLSLTLGLTAMAERQYIEHLVFVCGTDDLLVAEVAFVLGRFVPEQVALPSAVPHDLASGGNLESLFCGLFRFRGFPTWHCAFPS